MSRPFHYAFKVKDLESTRDFYMNILGCREGRSTPDWIDFDFYGNQLTGHVSSDLPKADYCGNVDGVKVPIPHFGCILSIAEFNELKKRLESSQVDFIIKPQIRYQGKTGEQWTMFTSDYSGNPLEFKAFKAESEMFL